MYTKDIILATAFLLYPFLLLMVSRLLDKSGVRKDMSRKFVHASMGIVILFIPFFDHKWIALIPPILFTAINLADLYWGIFSQIQGEDRGNVGTVLYPISYIILISLFYRTPYWGMAVLGVLAMAFGDAGASVVGREYGKTKYEISGEQRSVEGSAAMFTITFILAFIIFTIYSAQFGVTASRRGVLAASFIVASFATGVEALSIKGSDNITVPVLTALGGWGLVALMSPNMFGDQSIVNVPLYGE
ncbi:MAG TPA: hypothetical protein VGB30_02270 [bacterium]